jgi:ATP/maltotriose-dependent transcriptional regulator MalT
VPADASAAAARISILLAAARCAAHVWVDRSYAEEALALARQAGDEANEANALLILAMSRVGVGQAAGIGSEPIELITRARALAERAGAYGSLARAAATEAHLLEGAGEHELAVEASRRGTAGQDVQYVARASRSLLAINQVESLLALGRWDEAIQVAEAAGEFQLTSLPLHRAARYVLVGHITLARGAFGAAAEAASAAGQLLQGSPYEDEQHLPFFSLEILLRLATDGASGGIEAASRIANGYDLTGGSPRYAWPLLDAAASACVAAARRAVAAQDERLRNDAAALADRLRTIAEKLETFGRAQQAGQLTYTAADAHIAFLLAASPGPGRGRDAARAAELRAAWDQAAAARAVVSEPYPLARALMYAAESAIAGGDRDGAAQRLRRAAALAAELRADPLSEEIAILARRARIRMTGQEGREEAAGQDAGTGKFGLTGRELEVLRLVAAGRSNREIAAELFISPKTASVHVSNILGKLGAASRGEAAAKAHALRIFEPV